MNKKFTSFIILIILLLFLLYNIIIHKYKEYKINEHISIISTLNKQIKEKIIEASDIIEYKKSKAYKNKILKQNSGLKNKGETVVYITTEDNFNKYMKKEETISDILTIKKEELNSDTYNMTIYQKWIWFLFKKDLR